MASNKELFEKFGIAQFDGKGYDHWKFRMEIMLDQQNVIRCIKEENLTPNEEFTKLDKKCKALIIMCIANSQLQYVKDKDSAFQMWQALEKIFQRKGVASQLYLRKKLLTMKLNEDENLESYYIKFDEVVRELKYVGTKLEETDIVCHLLLSLPKSYDAIVTALETVEPEKLTLEFVKGKLLDHEMKRKHDKFESPNSAAFFNDTKNIMEVSRSLGHLEVLDS